uniref:Tetraspanin n=1 Tax=Ciona savignyi TaxID=51511 RepID=H2YBU3_CIOSA
MIFFIGGVVMAGLAGYGAFNKGSALHDMVTQTKSTVLLDGLYVLFAIGLFLAMLSLIGCWGAMGESKCLLYTYFVVMLIIFLIQMSGIIVCFVKYEAIKAFIMKTLHGNIQPNPSNLHTIATQLAAQTMFGKFEAKFHCCGFNGPKDYNGNPPAACYSTAVHGRRKRATNSSATVVSPTLAAIVATVTAKPATTKAVVVPVVTTTPKVATTAPKVATTAPKVATTTPKVATYRT